jgi:hypothetical protein
MRHLKKFNEGLIGRSDPDFEPSKKELLKDKIKDLILDNIETTNVPYGNWCHECNLGEQQIDTRSVDLVANEIIKLLKKEGLI